MDKMKSEVLIENENLFRALVCAPIAVLFALFSTSFVLSPGLILFKVIFVILALYFSLSTLAYAAYYTNDLHEENVDSIFNNKNLLSSLFCAPIAFIFVLFALNTEASSGYLFFKVIFVIMASYFVLKTLAHAAYYTNECHETKATE